MDPLRSTGERLRNLQSRPDVGGASEKEHAGSPATFPPCSIYAALYCVEKIGCLLELVDEQWQITFLDESRRICIGGFAKSRVVKRNHGRAPIGRDPFGQGALAALTCANDDYHRRVRKRRQHFGFHVSR